jgi:hypothetical protein
MPETAKQVNPGPEPPPSPISLSLRKQDLNFTKLLDNLFGLKSLAWHELPPSLEPIPELTTLEPVAIKGAGHRKKHPQ